MVLDSVRAAAQYLLAREGDGIIGYDGMGAIDLQASDVEMVEIGSRSRIANLEELRLQPNTSTPRIVMRRAVKEFDFLYADMSNALILSERAHVEIGPMIASSLRQVTPVECVFGKRTGRYVFANLRLYDCWRTCIDFAGSSFQRVTKGNRLVPYASILENGHAPLTGKLVQETERLTFDDLDSFEAYRNKAPAARWMPPETLTLRAEHPQVVVNIEPSQTLVALPVVEALLGLKRSKTKVLGMEFCYPAAQVRFTDGTHGSGAIA